MLLRTPAEAPMPTTSSSSTCGDGVGCAGDRGSFPHPARLAIALQVCISPLRRRERRRRRTDRCLGWKGTRSLVVFFAPLPFCCRLPWCNRNKIPAGKRGGEAILGCGALDPRRRSVVAQIITMTALAVDGPHGSSFRPSARPLFPSLAGDELRMGSADAVGFEPEPKQ